MIEEALGQTVINLDLPNYLSMTCGVTGSESIDGVSYITNAFKACNFDEERFKSDVIFWANRIGRYMTRIGENERWRNFPVPYQNLGVLQLTFRGKVLASFGFEQETQSTQVRSAFLALKTGRVMGEFYREIIEEKEGEEKAFKQYAEYAVHLFGHQVYLLAKLEAEIVGPKGPVATCVETNRDSGFTTISFDPFNSLGIPAFEQYLNDALNPS